MQGFFKLSKIIFRFSVTYHLRPLLFGIVCLRSLLWGRNGRADCDFPQSDIGRRVHSGNLSFLFVRISNQYTCSLPSTQEEASLARRVRWWDRRKVAAPAMVWQILKRNLFFSLQNLSLAHLSAFASGSPQICEKQRIKLNHFSFFVRYPSASTLRTVTIAPAISSEVSNTPDMKRATLQPRVSL